MLQFNQTRFVKFFYANVGSDQSREEIFFLHCIDNVLLNLFVLKEKGSASAWLSLGLCGDFLPVVYAARLTRSD